MATTHYKYLELADAKKVQGVAIVDSNGDIIELFGDASSGSAIAGSGSGNYSNATNDFTVTVNAGTKTITIVGASLTFEDINLQAGSLKIDGVSISLAGATIAANIITIPELETNFVGTEIAVLTFVDVLKAYQISEDSIKNIPQSAPVIVTEDVQPIVSVADIGTVLNTPIVHGGEIDVQGIDNVAIGITFIANNSVNGKLRIMSLLETGGAEYHATDPISYNVLNEIDLDSLPSVDNGSGAEVKTVITFETDNINFIKLITIVPTAGGTIGATEGTITLEICSVQLR